ncbi:hypothetical protein GGX14DRAFT_616484 [Mycena pura]|uniref:Uncharacterized protein n=1 Tax=Mycena pura TaxID=153505 RepID=A0AAD6YTM0_9AGAR|nr:hypothetical protein GGX14DRAFT_616484 [Mycena pura]
MSFTNINDPAGVKALLDRLRASQAWQDAVKASPEQPPPQPASAETSSASVAALLSQLNSAPTPGIPPNPRSLTPDLPPPPPPSAPSATPEDIRRLTFQQALPRLAQLCDDPAVVSGIEQARFTALKQEQDKVERDLWAERTSIRTKYEDKIKVAKTKCVPRFAPWWRLVSALVSDGSGRATLIGTGISRHEADMLTQAYERELRRFDAERALPAWDGLVAKQQAALAQIGIPTMFPTDAKVDRERQQRVIQILEGIVGSVEMV